MDLGKLGFVSWFLDLIENTKRDLFLAPLKRLFKRLLNICRIVIRTKLVRIVAIIGVGIVFVPGDTGLEDVNNGDALM